jgi:hypothetical protein
MKMLLAAITLSLAAPVGAQVVETYTAFQTGAVLRPLGYTVPLPVESLEPVAGFRSYAGLHARLQALALSSSDLAAQQVGSTIHGQPLWAYVVSSEGSVDSEGRAKPAFFINATTHAREWAAPEVSVGLVERMVTAPASDGLVRYLLDNTRLVIVPVQNVDGFRQTQRFPTQVVVGQDPRVPNDWPRDGRMRRKNMRGVDEVLTTFGDHLGGIDLNRNHAPFWGTVTNGGQLTNPNDLTFRGAAVRSEPEVQALVAAADLGPASRMRLGIDVHSHSRVFFSSNTGRERLTGIQSRLLGVLVNHHLAVPTANGVANNKRYTDILDPPNSGIGAAAEYFAYQWLVPAWTLELEPGDAGAGEYGGTAESHGGFILPDSEARRVREAWAESHMTAFYFMAGAPHLQRVELRGAATGSSVRHSTRWQLPAPGATVRERVVESSGRIRTGQRLSATLDFSKPMRRLLDGVASGLPGITIPLLPRVWLLTGGTRVELDLSAGRWSPSHQYPGTAQRFRFEFDAPAEVGEFGLEVFAVDLTSLPLDADPSSPVDWASGAWSGWNSGLGPATEGDTGGFDKNYVATAELDVPGPVPTIVGGLVDTAGEGDVLHIRLRLDAPATERVEVIGEDPMITIVRPVITPPPPEAPVVVWQPGEMGERLLSVQLADDAEALGDRAELLKLGLRVDGQVSEFLSHSLAVLDNDRAGQVVMQAGSKLRVALQQLQASPAASRELLLDGATRYVGPDSMAAVCLQFDFVAPLRVFGNRAVLAPGQAACSVATVQGSGVVELLDLGIDAQLADGSQRAGIVGGGTDLRLQRSWIGNVRGQAITHAGPLQLQQSAVVRSVPSVGTDALIDAGGVLRMAASSTVHTPGDSTGAGLIFRLTGAEPSQLQSISMTNIGYTPTRLIEGLSSVSASLQRDVDAVIGTPPPACSQVSSGGFNIFSRPSCFTAQPSDLFQSLQASTPVGPDLDQVLPTGAAIDFGGACGTVDQRGAPRPQTLAADAEPLCDAGAVELGVNPYRGIWQPARAGHGVDLQTAGNQLLLAWYTYDDDGQPTAYQAVAPLTGPRWRAELQRSRRDPQTGTVLAPVRVGDVGIDFVDDAHATLLWQFDSHGTGGSEAIVASLFAPGEPGVDVTGLWFPPMESGYGATITRRGSITAVGLYYYDASGALRWALGTGSANSADDIAMTSYTGFCPDCDAASMPVQAQPGGRLLFHFLTPRRARIDTELQYPGAAGGSWFREAADFVPLNDPVDNRAAAALLEP